ncbi:BON domain-containing protein [Undibacterium sp. Di26W]|uniref:BON domain-containing protein n=1 Tax=Undibacterium sp. Di26W TaxID=3413035 RepID=UPI003BF1B4BE
MRSDNEILLDVQSGLAWETGITAADFAVTVKDGVVELSGKVASFSEKQCAELAVMRVFDVIALNTEVEVHLSIGDARTDRDIGHALERLIQVSDYLNQDKISFTVENCNVTLSGTLEWEFQRNELMHGVAGLTGLRGLCNQLKIEP